ncbi:MAG TPA: ABC transporter ATP-binding protein [Patescibacteria group bacterium]|nr:ABC transporter ATP-binding protein [Patescibacteria group bacterium]
MATPISRKTVKIYLAHTLNHKRDFWVVLLAAPIAQFADDFAVPILISHILTMLATASAAHHELQLSSFMPYMLGILAAEVFQLLAWNRIVRSVWRMEERTMQDLATTAFTHLLTMSQRFFSNRFGGSIVSQVNKFVGSYERLADGLIWTVYKLIIGFVLTAVILIRPAPLYVVGITVLAAVYIYTVYHLKKRELSLNKHWAETENRRTGQLADSVTNIAAVKSFAHEKLEATLFQGRAQDVTDSSLKTMRHAMNSEVFTNSIQRLIQFTAILVSLWLAVNGKVQVGLVYLILTYTGGIMGRLWEMNGFFRNLNRVFGDAQEMTEILGMEPEVKNIANPEPAHFTRGDILFKKVDFKHNDDGARIFKKLDLHIKPGEKVGLVGPSGSGKTSLTYLLLRMMDIQKGEIVIDGHNIARVAQEDLRSHIAYVPQEPLMFHRSIMDNIRYGQLDASDKQVFAAAKMSNAHEFIQSLPNGYDTMVGERGTKLSGGQRQRIAIARAMLKNAPILVLDEATSALDSESEVLIQDALWKLMEGRTAIVIAHRLSTIQKMDRILVLEKGTIVEQGTHKELLNTKGVYAKLWSHQSGGFIED